VHAAQHEQQPRGVGGTVEHDVDGQRLALGARQVEHPAVDGQAACRGRLQELAARYGIGRAEQAQDIGVVHRVSGVVVVGRRWSLAQWLTAPSA
jgi:hypothetical protein